MSKRNSSYKSLLGIELDEGRMTVVSVARNGSGHVVKHVAMVPLSLDPLNHEPELVGREIRNHLDQLKIQEKRCIVCVPLQWVMSHPIELPELSPEDEEDYLRLQAENGFPFSVEDLSLSLSRYKAPGNQKLATFAAMTSNHTQILQKIFKAANLRLLSITISIASLDDRKSSHGAIFMHAKDTCIEFMIWGGGGVVMLRRFEIDRHDQELDNEATLSDIARQIRISLGQLSPNLRPRIRDIYIVGGGERIRSLYEGLNSTLEDLRLSPAKIDADELAVKNVDALKLTQIPLYKAVRRLLIGQSSEFEFLPPQIDRLKQITQRVSSKGNLVFGGAAALIFLIVLLAFAYQHFRLISLENRWSAVEEQVAEVENLQNKVKQFRPWFNDSATGLSALKTLTEAFPEEGSVWAKMVEIEDLSQVTCAGFARNNSSWLKMHDHLKDNPQVADLQVQQIQGDAPLQFAFQFRWLEGENE
ncbi:MAG: hypothetical protein JXR73_08015 [Candidatus Omnitrophica bacterium]|nr:hypothetical protein [Candidatus Omnitrophota bacterium]